MKGSSLKENRVPTRLAYVAAMHRAHDEGKRVFFMMEQKEINDFGGTDYETGTN